METIEILICKAGSQTINACSTTLTFSSGLSWPLDWHLHCHPSTQIPSPGWVPSWLNSTRTPFACILKSRSSQKWAFIFPSNIAQPSTSIWIHAQFWWASQGPLEATLSNLHSFLHLSQWNPSPPIFLLRFYFSVLWLCIILNKFQVLYNSLSYRFMSTIISIGWHSRIIV